MKNVAVLVFDKCMASSVTGPVDLFNICNTIWAQYDPAAAGKLFSCQLVSLDGQPVISSSGLQLIPDTSLEDMEPPDLFLIGSYHYESIRGLQAHFQQLLPLHATLSTLVTQGCHVAAFCTGTFVLAQAELLEQRPSTTSWWLRQLFEHSFPTTRLVMDQLVVRSDNVWTAGATTAYTSLCLKLVEEMVGPQVASQASKVLLVDNNRLSQLPYMTVQTAVGHKDKAIADCQSWLQSHLSEPIELQDMADYCVMGKRTFIRRFKKAVLLTPASYLQQLRIDAAKRYLENTNHPLEQIIGLVGYDDISAFRRVFHKSTELTPAAYRKKFSRLPASLSGSVTV